MDRPRPQQLKLQLELPLEDTIDVFTASRVAKVSTSTIQRWCEEKRFPSFKLGRPWMIERKPFYAWIESRHFRPD